MAKISAYPDGGAVQSADQFVVARGGQNFSILGSQIGSGGGGGSGGSNTGETAVVNLTSTSLTSVLSNAAGSGKVLKVNSLYVANVDGTNNADITIRFYSAAALGGTPTAIVNTVVVPADASLLVISEENPIYLVPDRSIGAVAGAANDLKIVCSYEETTLDLETIGVSLTTTNDTAILSNAAGSGKVLKVNALIVANVDGTNNADITIRFYSAAALGGTAYEICNTVVVPADASLVVITLSSPIYLVADRSIGADAGAANDLDVICSYEEIT